MKCRTYKSNIIPMPMRPFVLLSWALIVGGTAMMVLAGVPVIIIATALLLFVWWRKPSRSPRSASGCASHAIPSVFRARINVPRAASRKQYRPSRRLCWPPRRLPAPFRANESTTEAGQLILLQGALLIASASRRTSRVAELGTPQTSCPSRPADRGCRNSRRGCRRPRT